MAVDATDGPGKLSDSVVIIRILYYCTVPRTPSEIMFYCGMDRSQLTRITQHCIRKNLVKLVSRDTGLMAFVLTEHGNEVLSATEDITKILNLGPDGE